MCGFAGVTSKNIKSLNHNKILQNLLHRGPDANGVYINKQICLFHSRLSILDLRQVANQPMIDKETKVTIVYNGEIYNFKKLKMKVSDAKFYTKSDTEVILKLYLKFGCNFFSLLEGMFSFVIWDPRSKETILVRDRFGIKPLFYLYKKKELYFSSEIKSLLSLGVKKQLDLNTVSEYLNFGMPGTLKKTFFKNIKNFPAGHYLKFKDGRIKLKKFWNIEEFQHLHLFDKNKKKIEDDTYDILKSTIKKHLISDVPVGLCLSSGTDSKLLLYFLNELGVKKINTFTYGFLEQEYNEFKNNNINDLDMQITYNSKIITPFNIFKNLETAIEKFEIPLGGLGTLGLWQLMSLAKEKNVPVLLSGEGLDEGFAGYQYYIYHHIYDLYKKKKYNRIKKEVQELKNNFGIRLKLNKSFFDNFSKIKDHQLMAPDSSLLAGHSFLNKSFQSEKKIIDIKSNKIPYFNSLKQRIYEDIFIYKLPKLLWYLDRASMSWGIESRVPFIDNKLLQHTFRLPADMLIKRGISKYLPKKILQKFSHGKEKKKNKLFVSTPQREWIKYTLREKILEYIEKGLLVENKVILFNSFKKEFLNYTKQKSLGNSFFVWKILNLEAFFRVFFNKGI